MAKLHQTFEETGLVVVTHYSGMTVAEVTNLRRQMRDAGAGFKVTKNRLARLALAGTRFEGLASLFSGPTAVAFSADPVAAARAAVAYANSNEKLKIVGFPIGIFDEVSYDEWSTTLAPGDILVLYSDGLTEAINVDGDRAAAMLASALKVEKLIILSNVPGLLKDLQDEGSLIPDIPFERIEEFAAFARGRMKKKVLGAVEAIREGVKEVVFADARRALPITEALLGKGTVIH